MERVENIAEVENPLTGVESLEEDSGGGGGEGKQNYRCVLDLEDSRHEGDNKHLKMTKSRISYWW